MGLPAGWRSAWVSLPEDLTWSLHRGETEPPQRGASPLTGLVGSRVVDA
jgi:hypothetical protein